MSDNISRQAAINAVCANCLRQDLDVFDGCLDEDCSIKPVLESLPSTDRKGHWICNGGDDWICSNCGVETHADEDYWTDDVRAYKMNFCHYCGADMRGEENGFES